MALLERQAFLGILGTHLAAARHGNGSVVLVCGEAGIGKTSLVEAFCAAAPGATRILRGTCDPLVPARPFTPLVDISHRVGGDLPRALAEGNRDGVIDAMLVELRRRDAGPAIVVFDDLHWADEATLDLLRVLGRRVSQLAVLLIGTYRDHEVGSEHPLRMALGEIPAEAVTELRLPPLTIAAVGRLAAGRGDAATLHAITGGNPFFVTEVLAGDGPHVPATVRDAVLARVARLLPAAQEVVRVASVLGPGCDVRILLEVAGEPESALDEALAHAVLERRDDGVSFRHELGRRAVLDGLPLANRIDIHARALVILGAEGSTDQARLARHAIGAGDAAGILAHARPAGGRAASLGSHREAVAFYRAAVAIAGDLEPSERADLYEQFARECSLTDDPVAAVDAQRTALDLWRGIESPVREGASLTALSGMLWYAGAGNEALGAARSAVELLKRDAPGTVELAHAWAVLAQRQLVGFADYPDIMTSARVAVELAERLGDERVAVHAMTTLSIAEIFMSDSEGWSRLEASVRRAHAAHLDEEAARALINLFEAARDFRHYDLADDYQRQVTAFLEDQDFALYHHIMLSIVAGLELDIGRWEAAFSHATSLVDGVSVATPLRARALSIVGRILARRGESDRWSALDEALRLAAGDPQVLMPLRAARAEAAWLDDDDAQAREEAVLGMTLVPHDRMPWWWSELAFWAWKAGAREPLPTPSELPFAEHVRGRHADAALAWRAIGAPYEEALALSDSDEESDLRAALDTFNRLGGRAMAIRVRRKLKARGAIRIARGPRSGTRANPARLTAREVEVLGLVASGHGNGDIAARLVISQRTVDHHVAASLRKLGVANRRDAIVAARRLGVLDPPPKDRQAATAR